MVGPLVIAGVALTVDRVAGVGLASELVVPNLEVFAQIVDINVTVDNQALCQVIQPRHPQRQVTLGVGDRQLLSSLLLAIFGDIFPREDITVLAMEGTDKLERSAPPPTLAIGISFISSGQRNVQDARKFAIVLVFHRANPITDARTTDDANAKSTNYMQRSGPELKNCSIGCATYGVPLRPAGRYISTSGVPNIGTSRLVVPATDDRQ